MVAVKDRGKPSEVIGKIGHSENLTKSSAATTESRRCSSVSLGGLRCQYPAGHQASHGARGTEWSVGRESLCPEHGIEYRTSCPSCVEAVERPGGARATIRSREHAETIRRITLDWLGFKPTPDHLAKLQEAVLDAVDALEAEIERLHVAEEAFSTGDYDVMEDALRG